MAIGFLGIGVILLIVSLAGLGVYGFPVAALFLLMGVGALVMGKGGGGKMERSKRPEPTGMPRASSAAGDTANERQGQV